MKLKYSQKAHGGGFLTDVNTALDKVFNTEVTVGEQDPFNHLRNGWAKNLTVEFHSSTYPLKQTSLSSWAGGNNGWHSAWCSTPFKNESITTFRVSFQAERTNTDNNGGFGTPSAQSTVLGRRMQYIRRNSNGEIWPISAVGGTANIIVHFIREEDDNVRIVTNAPNLSLKCTFHNGNVEYAKADNNGMIIIPNKSVRDYASRWVQIETTYKKNNPMPTSAKYSLIDPGNNLEEMYFSNLLINKGYNYPLFCTLLAYRDNNNQVWIRGQHKNTWVGTSFRITNYGINLWRDADNKSLQAWGQAIRITDPRIVNNTDVILDVILVTGNNGIKYKIVV